MAALFSMTRSFSSSIPTSLPVTRALMFSGVTALAFEEYHRSFRDGRNRGFQQCILQPAHEGVVDKIHAISVVAEAVQ